MLLHYSLLGMSEYTIICICICICLTIYIICIRICTRRGRGLTRKWAGLKPEVGVVWSEMGGVISVCYFKPEIDMH